MGPILVDGELEKGGLEAEEHGSGDNKHSLETRAGPVAALSAE